MRWLAPVTIVFAAATAAVPTRAELVVFTNGHFLKVDTYEVEDKKVIVETHGGRLILPLSTVERIVGDEILPPEEAVPPPEPEGLDLSFSDGAPVPETPFGDLIFATARRHGVNPALVAAMVRAESAFDRNAVSVKGARGLLQLMPATARRFGVEHGRLFDPAANLEAGVRYLKWLRGRFADDLPLVLAAYNAGEGNVDRYGGVPPFRETRDYIERVYRFLGLDPAAA